MMESSENSCSGDTSRPRLRPSRVEKSAVAGYATAWQRRALVGTGVGVARKDANG